MGVVVEKTFDTLLIELNEKEESSLFFDTTKVSLDCTKCKGDLVTSNQKENRY